MIEFINAHRISTICQTFKDLATRTWEYLDEGVKIRMPPGEETLTDENLFAISAIHSKHITVWRFTKAIESKTGADWEWWFGNKTNGWFGMRVQAKRINLTKFSYYSGVDHNKNKQIDDLIRESQKAGRFPAYCLYNTQISHKSPEFGCSIVSAQVMHRALLQSQSQGSNNVQLSDIKQNLFPWHDLVCPRGTVGTPNSGFPDQVRNSVLSNLPADEFGDISGVHSSLPDEIMNLLYIRTSLLKYNEFLSTDNDELLSL